MTVSSTASSVRRREEEAAVGFTALQTLTEALQQILVDLIELHLRGKQAHWNLIGRNFGISTPGVQWPVGRRPVRTRSTASSAQPVRPPRPAM